jgi:hypothetical protein
MRARLYLVTVAACLVALVLGAPSGVHAAAPPNDNLADATVLNLPESVDGTVVDATVEDGEPSSCRAAAQSVWYRFRAPAGGRLVALLDTAGELDAVIDVVLRARSDVTSVGCEATDRRGQAMLDLEDLEPGANYLMRVAQRTGECGQLPPRRPRAAKAGPATRTSAAAPRRDGER